MARIFITGSADGLGYMAAKSLADQGHRVVLHARNPERGREALNKVPTAEKVLIADLSVVDETKRLAAEVNTMGGFDVVIHNAGVYQASRNLVFSVNTLAPYILTCMIQRPKRLIYISSGLHLQGNPNVENLTFAAGTSYSSSKLHELILCMAVARKWPTVYANAVDPGWVPTKMGGRGAPDNLEKGFETQAWLAVSNDDQARVSGRYFYHQKQKHYLPVAADVYLQEKFLTQCEQATGVRFPTYQE